MLDERRQAAARRSSSRSGRRTPPAATGTRVDQHDAPLDPNFSGAGRCLTDDDGRYRFVTIKPGRVPVGQPPERLAAARTSTSRSSVARSRERLVTQMYFPGDPLFPFDPIFNSVRDEARGERLSAASTSS